MDRQEEDRDVKQTGFSLSQETITILTVGVALAGLILVNMGEMRAEARADRAEARAEREAMRAEGQANREAFEQKIIRLVEQQGTLNGLVDGLRHAVPPPRE